MSQDQKLNSWVKLVHPLFIKAKELWDLRTWNLLSYEAGFVFL